MFIYFSKCKALITCLEVYYIILIPEWLINFLKSWGWYIFRIVSVAPSLWKSSPRYDGPTGAPNGLTMHISSFHLATAATLPRNSARCRPK